MKIMRPKRVDCADCKNFKFPTLSFCGLILEKESCELGKKVMFRINGLHPDSGDWECGWRAIVTGKQIGRAHV